MNPQKRYIPLAERSKNGLHAGFSDGTLDEIMRGIAHVESGGRYDAVGQPNSRGQRAYGKYQVFETNLPSWTREALGRELTPDAFLADQDAQERVARHFMGNSLKKYGNPDDVASVWFTGRPVSEAGLDVADYTGTSNAAYLQKFKQGMGGTQRYIPISQRRMV